MNELDNRNFENIQRILSDTSSVQIALMTLTLSFQSAGFVGLYSIADKIRESNSGVIGLSILMISISFILGFVWYREHIMSEAFKKRLSSEFNVWEPGKSFWSGKTALMWKIIHSINIIVWMIIFILGTSGCLAKMSQLASS